MKITYQAQDGYVSGDRPLYVRIHDSEILDCESVEEAMQVIEEAIQSDFQERVTPGYDFAEIKQQVAKLFQTRP